jgi:type II secretory pathway component PulF
MPLYQHESFNKSGKIITGTIDAATKDTAISLLRQKGLMPIKVMETSQTKKNSFASIFAKKIDNKSKVQFTKQLGVLLTSGVPLLKAIELLSEQFEGEFKTILINVKDGIKEGSSLASELAKYPKVFTNIYVQLVKAGEASGKLEVILKRLTIYIQKLEETKKKIKGAMTQPIIMISVALLVVVGVLKGIIPKMKKMFDDMGKELPEITQFLIDVSDVFNDNFWLISIVFCSLIVGFLYWKSTPGGRYKIDEIMLKIPMISYFSKTKAVVEFSKTLGMLLESGTNLSEALEIVCKIVENRVLTKKLLVARDNIIKEGKIAKYLKKTEMFPSIASYMISTGEESGQLAEMLITVGDDYEEELTEITDQITAALTPIMTVVMGLIILFVILAMFMPIVKMSTEM